MAAYVETKPYLHNVDVDSTSKAHENEWNLRSRETLPDAMLDCSDRNDLKSLESQSDQVGIMDYWNFVV